MFRSLNILKFLKKPRGKAHPEPKPRYDMPVSAENIALVFSGCDDFVAHEVLLGGEVRIKPTVCFIDGIVSSEAISRDVLRPLTSAERFGGVSDLREAVALMSEGMVTGSTVKVRESMDELVEDVLRGFCAVVLEGCAVTFETKGGEKRAVGEARSEKAVKGSRDCLTEVLRTNTGLIRRRMRDSDLKICELTVGRRTGTNIAILYIKGLTNGAMVQGLRARLAAMDVDGVLSPSSLEEYIVEKPGSPFPQVQSTERPDKLCIALLEGRAAVLADGLPMGFILPGTLSEFFKVPDDVAGHYIVASAITLVRYVSLVVSLLLPAVYVAVSMYHQEMLPTKLMLSIIESRQEVPFSTAVEVLGMMLALELLQEASLRLPQNIGDTMGIIGALIVGQSAVEAKVISPAVVIVAAIAGITGYTVPDQDLSAAMRLFRFAFAGLAVALGLFGIVIGVILLVWHLSTLENLGVPYLWPLAGGNAREVSRAVLRWPVRSQKHRKRGFNVENARERA